MKVLLFGSAVVEAFNTKVKGDAARTVNPVGMSFVRLAFLISLVLLGRHVWAAFREE